MRRSASEIINDLENRIAQLEKQASTTGSFDYLFLNELQTKLGSNSPLYMLGESLDRMYQKDFKNSLKSGENEELVKELIKYSKAVKSEQDKLKNKILDMMSIIEAR